jgi:hypothetical protein
MDLETELTQDEQRFLRALHNRLGGDPTGSASMFDVGESLGIDRAESSRIAENLMGWEMVEVRTLAGAIGITSAAADLMGESDREGQAAGLGSASVIDDGVRQRVETLITDLKSRIGEMGLPFDSLSEMTADLKSIDAQLASPKPKTAILRACFESIAHVLSQTGKSDPHQRVQDFLKA